MRHVRGACPACGSRELALTRGGALVCCQLDCPRPSAAAELLGVDVDVDHVVQISRGDFTLRHPLIEHLDDALLTCRLHDTIAAAGPGRLTPGRYRVVDDGRILAFEPVR